MKKVTHAVVWTNGMVMAFDAAGQQVPEYQGRKEEVLEKIKIDFPDADIKNGDWNRLRGIPEV